MPYGFGMPQEPTVVREPPKRADNKKAPSLISRILNRFFAEGSDKLPR